MSKITNKIFWCYSITWFLFLLYSCAMVYFSNERATIRGINSNLLMWGFGVLAFCLGFLFLMRVLHIDMSIPYYGILILGISIIWLCIGYFRELDIYPYSAGRFQRHANLLIFLVLLIIVLAILRQFMITSDVNVLQKYASVDTILCIGVALIAFAFMFAPNVFLCEGAGLPHTHAYENSILNVFYLTPYDDVSSSIYGHYGLLYLLPVRFFSLFFSVGMSVSICVALAGALTYVSYYLVVKKIFSSRIFIWVSMICALYPIVAIYSHGEYFQVYPHRVLFPMLILLTCLYDNNSKKMKFLQFLTVILSIIWNLEVGLACAAMLAAYNVFNDLSHKGWRLQVIIKSLLSNALMCIFLFTISYISVNIYNLCVGGGWNSIRTFIYPIASDYNIDKLRVALNSVFSEWFVFNCIFLLGVVVGIGWLFSKQKDKYIETETVVKNLFLISVLGIALMPYYMNRAVVANISIVYEEVILAILILINYCVKKVQVNKVQVNKVQVNKGESMKGISTWNGILLALLLPVSVMICEVIMGFAGNISIYSRSIWNTESLNHIVEEIQEDETRGLITSDVIAFGTGMPELFAYAGIQTNCHITDWSDMNQYSLDVLDNKLENAKEVLMDQSITDEEVLNRLSDMTLLKTYTIGEYTYGLYTKL